jgi:NADPH:quinone reductase-like Zn-dependent oxidoreductase
MKAVLFKRAGSADGLVLDEIPEPVPEANEILVKVRAASVTRGDVVLRRIPRIVARLFRLGRKAILGHEFAGDVKAVGSDVRLFKIGDRVFGTTTGLGTGSYAEYICVPADGVITRIPAGVRYEEAAPIPIGGMTALHFLREGGVGRGKLVLVYGASGSVGTFAVQLAHHFGAHVTGVCSTSNVELVRSLGADEVIDYTQEDFTQGGRTYDVIFDAVGKASPKRSQELLTVNGKYVSVRSSTERRENLLEIAELLDIRAIKAVIDRRYALADVREAHRYVERGRKRGNVAITVAKE